MAKVPYATVLVRQCTIIGGNQRQQTRVHARSGQQKKAAGMQQTTIPSIDVQTTLSTPETSEQAVAISIVVPVMNEQESVRLLYEKLSAQLDTLGQCYEVFFVDDGRTDNTLNELKI